MILTSPIRFFVNLHTKKSQWEQPTSPARGPSEESHPSGPPPGYTGSDNPALANTALDSKKGNLGSGNTNNPPYSSVGAGGLPEDDAAMAARLQAEEDARGRGHSPRPPDMQNQNPGASTDYYGQSMPVPLQQGSQGGYPGGGAPGQQQYGGDINDGHRASKSGGAVGLLGKLAGKLSGKAGGSGHGGGYGHYGGGYQQHGYGGGGYPPQQYGGYGAGMMGGHRPPPRKGGMGAGGAAALGVGGGLVGGMMLANAMDDNDYSEGYQDGQQDDFDGGGGGDMGDMGGGDF